MVVPVGAVVRRGPGAQPTRGHRSLEDPRQPPAQLDEPGRAPAPRPGVDLAPGFAGGVDPCGARAPAGAAAPGRRARRPPAHGSARPVRARRYMLQWTTAANTELGIARASLRALSWRTVGWSPALALSIAAVVAWVRPSALLVAAPLLAIWLAAPEIAALVGRPRRPRFEPLRPDEHRYLRM